MCGIVGLIDFREKKIKDNINSMLDRIYLRGPDGEGRYSENGIELAMRRLSIIDIEGGTQPFYSHNNRTSQSHREQGYRFRLLARVHKPNLPVLSHRLTV